MPTTLVPCLTPQAPSQPCQGDAFCTASNLARPSSRKLPAMDGKGANYPTPTSTFRSGRAPEQSHSSFALLCLSGPGLAATPRRPSRRQAALTGGRMAAQGIREDALAKPRTAIGARPCERTSTDRGVSRTRPGSGLAQDAVTACPMSRADTGGPDEPRGARLADVTAHGSFRGAEVARPGRRVASWLDGTGLAVGGRDRARNFLGGAGVAPPRKCVSVKGPVGQRWPRI